MAVSKSATRREPASHAKGARGDTDFGDDFNQEINQAIQPLLDDFRQRIAHTLTEQLADISLPHEATPTTGEEAQTESQSEKQASSTASQPAPASKAPKLSMPKLSLPKPSVPKPSAVVDAVGAGAERVGGELKEKALQLPEAIQKTLGRAIGQGLQALLVTGLTALLSDASRVIVQQRAEQGLHALLQKAHDAAPDDFADQEMWDKIEHTLQLILREALEAVFAEAVRTTIQRDGQQSVQQAMNGDFGGMLKSIEETQKILVTELLAALRRHQRTLIRLALAFALLAMEYSLEHSAKSEPSAKSA